MGWAIKVHFQLYLDHHVITLLLRCLGCTCYPTLRPYLKAKFNFRSTPCIFLGYASNHKGYYCYDPSTCRTYISRNVTFNEEDFSLDRHINLPEDRQIGNQPSSSFHPEVVFPCGPILSSTQEPTPK